MTEVYTPMKRVKAYKRFEDIVSFRYYYSALMWDDLETCIGVARRYEFPDIVTVVE